jgi:hypothetical protein
VKQHFLAAAAERDEQLDTRDEREALALAAIEHAENLGRAGLALPLNRVSVSGSNSRRAWSIALSATTASLNSSLASRSIVSHEPSMQ